MGTAVDQGPVSKGANPLFCMAFPANVYGHPSYDMPWILGFRMLSPRAVADLAASVFQLRGLFNTNKATGFTISCSMAGVAPLDFLWREALLHFQDTLKRVAFPGIFGKVLVFVLVAQEAGLRTHIGFWPAILCPNLVTQKTEKH